MIEQEKIVTREIREVSMKLLVGNRSLDLCSRMNYETENLDFIDDIPSGSTLYDLGACEGRFAVYASLKKINVYAFEPEKMNFSALQRNKELNLLDDAQLTVYNKGVSNSSTSGTIQIGQPWPGGHQKVVDHGSKSRQDLAFDFLEKQTIALIALDEFIAQEKIKFPDYLKVDIDGSESPFIEGAKKTLIDSRLKGLIFELNKKDEDYETIIKTLSTYGLNKVSECEVPNEPNLFNIIFRRV